MKYFTSGGTIVSIALFLSCLQGQLLSAHPVLNEFMASNGETVADKDGDHSDWIELYNPASEYYDLSGHWLSDDSSSPMQWRFPDGVTIAPKGFLLVWASGKDRSNSEAELHTDFSLSASGEELLLSDAEGLPLDRVSFEVQERDVSTGRTSDGGGEWGAFSASTPGRSNGVSEPESIPLPPLVFSHPSGFYTSDFELSITSTVPDTTIYYTLDGSIPDPENLDGTTYRFKDRYPHTPGDPFGEFSTDEFVTIQHDGSTIPISDQADTPDRRSGRTTTYHSNPSFYLPTTSSFKGVMVRALQVGDGWKPSPVATHSYFVTEEGDERYSIKVVSMAIQDDHLFDYDHGVYTAGVDMDNWRRANPQGTWGTTTSSNYRRKGIDWEYPIHLEVFEGSGPAVFSQDAGFRIHGNSSRILPQKSLRFYAREEYSGSKRFDHPLIPGVQSKVDDSPVNSFKRMTLHNDGSNFSRSRHHDATAHRILEPLAPAVNIGDPVVSFINGEYWGVAYFRQRMGIDYLEDLFGIDADNITLLENNAQLVDGDSGLANQFLSMRNYLVSADANDPVVYDYVTSLIDLESFLQYHAAQIFIMNNDWPGNNIHFWRVNLPDPDANAGSPADGRWRWLFHDLDSTFKTIRNRPVSYNSLAAATAENGPSWPNPPWSTVLLRKLLENETIGNRFVNTMADLLNTVFVSERLNEIHDWEYNRIKDYLPEHRTRWRSTSDDGGASFRAFTQNRARYVQSHVVEYFELPGTEMITLRVADQSKGSIRINTVTINEDTPGLNDSEAPYPWSGEYFQGVPIEVEAIPLPGYSFVRWIGLPDEHAPDSSVATIELDSALDLEAVFEVSEDRFPHQLAKEPFAFDFWSEDSPPRSYPPSMEFWQTSEEDPTLSDEMESLWTQPYNLSSRSRINGLGSDGFSFVNTGNPQNDEAGYLGTAVLSLNTSDCEQAVLYFEAGTVNTNFRSYGLRLQWRAAPDDDFVNLLLDGKPLEYLRNEEDGHREEFGPIILPTAMLGNAEAQLRWKYYSIPDGASGARAELAIHKIGVYLKPKHGSAWITF